MIESLVDLKRCVDWSPAESFIINRDRLITAGFIEYRLERHYSFRTGKQINRNSIQFRVTETGFSEIERLTTSVVGVDCE